MIVGRNANKTSKKVISITHIEFHPNLSKLRTIKGLVLEIRAYNSTKSNKEIYKRVPQEYHNYIWYFRQTFVLLYFVQIIVNSVK